MKRKIFLVLLVGMFLLPVLPARSADSSLIPEFNPICWEEAECLKVRKDFGASSADAPKGFLKNEAPCDKEGWGKCLPAGVIETEVKFGGQTQFKDVGQFILVNYNYALSIAGILAAVMIIIAGAQYVTSGGNSEAISSAKKRIGGALIGLLIAYLSYVILNTINPALVNLRLPQTFMIKTNSLTPEFCSQAASSSVFAFAGEPGVKVDKTKSEAADFSLSYNPKDFICGKQYYVKKSGGAICKGDVCDPGNVCYQNKDLKEEFPKCVVGMLAGTIKGDPGFFCSDLDDNIFDNNLMLIAMCKDGDLERVDDLDLPDKARNYMFEPNNLSGVCGGKDNLAGFYLGGETNDEGGGFYGSSCPANPASSGCDDWHAIGKNTGGECVVNLGTLGYKILNSVAPDCEADYGKRCSCAAISDEPNIKILASNSEFVKSLISLEELQKGFVCNITIMRSNFPGLNNDSKWNPIQNCSGDDNTDCWDDQNSL